ncbi:hypothetical protein [Pyruvatibacter sp.]|uniref:hypothetical protein n=1 Tax=Pyruvatibacter sp. TaxID=1981328 RepID=UPI003267DA2E
MLLGSARNGTSRRATWAVTGLLCLMWVAPSVAGTAARMDSGNFDPTPYKERTFSLFNTNDGWEDERVEGNSYTVAVAATSVTTQTRTLALAIVRLAELAEEQGHRFIGIDEVESGMICNRNIRGEPKVKVSAHSALEPDFTDGEIVLSVGKINSNMRDAVVNFDGRGTETNAHWKNSDNCAQHKVANYERPWAKYDILAATVDAAVTSGDAPSQ